MRPVSVLRRLSTPIVLCFITVYHSVLTMLADSSSSSSTNLNPPTRPVHTTELGGTPEKPANENSVIHLRANTTDDIVRTTWWGGNSVCNVLQENPDSHIAIDLAFPSCMDLYKQHSLGTGNWIWILGGIRLAAKYHGKTQLQISCKDSHDSRASLVLPWMMGKWDQTGNTDRNILAQVCKGHMNCPMDLLVPEIVEQLQNMALSLWSPPVWHKNRLEGRDAPRIDHEWDEVAVHFRCGDLIKSQHRGYGLHKFGVWARHIAKDVGSIGIVSQPQSSSPDSQKRRRDNSSSDNGCDEMLDSLVRYLEIRFPNAKVNLRNDGQETITTAYSRLIFAKQAIIAGWSTFGVYAALSSFGEAFVIRPNVKGAPNRWLNKDTTLPVKLITDNKTLLAPQAYSIWYDEDGNNRSSLIRWLEEEEFEIPLERYRGNKKKSEGR